MDSRNEEETEELGQSFGWALKQLWNSKKVARQGWNGKGMWLGLQTPDINSKMASPYIYMRPADGALVPWVASQSDLLCADWIVVSE